MKQMLDFSLLPDLSYAHFKMDFGDDIEHGMCIFKDTYERANGAIFFLSAYGSVGKPRTKKQSEAFLRAALAEFVSMEDAIKRDLKKANIIKSPIRINDSKNPLLHMIRELRNLDIHIRTSKVTAKNRQALWGNKDFKSNTNIPIDYSFNVINPIKFEDFYNLDNAKYYNEEEIIILLEWFENAQNEWGINELIFRAVKCFCKEIVECYQLKT